MRTRRFLLAAATAALMARGDVTLLSPVCGEVFHPLTDWQMKVFAGGTREARFEILKGVDEKATRKEWRRQRPLVLKWRTTAGEKYPWRIRLATKPDFSDARDFWVEKDDVKCVKSGNGSEATWEYTVPLANLELGKTYCWQVWSGVKCREYACGFTYPDRCKCGKTKCGVISPVATFTTAGEPPRWIELEGRVKNVRDLGGWRTQNGGKVRMGLAYRGQGLNDNSVAGLAKGRNRLMVEDIDYMLGTLGIKTDLDLRSDREVADMAASPLGAGAAFVNHSSPEYGGVTNEAAKAVVAANMRLFADRANYPIYFHCIAGADRTGTLAFLLNGFLGVDKEDLERDWEATFYPDIPQLDRENHWRSITLLEDALNAYGNPDDTLQRRIELFLLDCGMTPQELAAIRSIMLEGE